jgi:hypothetical protein
MGGLAGFGAVAIVANPSLGISRGIGKSGGSFIAGIPRRTSDFSDSVATSYKAGAVEGGLKSGVMKVMEEQRLLMMGAGAGIGAMIGIRLNQDNPDRGAVVGSVVGGGAGLAVSAGIRASRVWNKFGMVGKAGAIGALTAVAFGATSMLSRSKYATVDQAQPEDYNMQDRMNAIGATGDVVFGLHNGR